ncbi:MAG TPA: formate dehydrogenase subunit alpha [Terracidiphilus sp.]|nr:formate dehydrogenase subunit alpha [Terracidiphilus sp.]
MAAPKRLLNTPLQHHPDILVHIDGAPYPAGKDELLIEVINREIPERKMPQVCYHPQLGPIETCDTCMVEVDGSLQRACATIVTDGMNVATASSRADMAQREAFDRLLEVHDLYCTVCDNNNKDCTVHNTTASMNVKHQSRPFVPKPYPQDHSNPFYRYDPSQCILCGRCVEACQNVQVNETLTIDWESEHPRVLWDGGTEIAGSSCVSCGHCVTVCPCNALMEKSMLGEAGYFTALPKDTLNNMIDVVKGVEKDTGFGPILALSASEADMRETRTRRTKTVCTYCGVGCTFDVWTKGRHILKIQPGEGPANGISTCVKGKFAWDYVNSPDRLTWPLIRTRKDDGSTGFRRASWDEALNLIAERFTQIKRDHGPDALAFIASSKCTNEESYLMQKLARAVIGTNNVDNCSRYCQSPATKGLQRTVGFGADTGSIADLEQAGLIVIVGSNTAENHPVLATRLKRSHKFRGQRHIVADLRRHEMAERADLFIRPNPSTDAVWINAVARHILDQGRHRQDLIDQWVHGFDDYKKSLEPYTLEFAEKRTGVPADTLRQIADEIVNADGVCFVFAMGVTQHCGGSDAATSISNLLLLTGNYMRPGAGSYPMRGHNNVQGASDFGSMPNVYSGYQHVDEEDKRAKFEAAWGVKLPSERGLDNHEMIRAVHEGKLKCIYLKGEDTITSDANANDVSRALNDVEFLVVQDVNFSSTAQFADVVLPAAPSLEKEGTFVNTERRIQRLYQVFEPLAESKPDWEIIQMIANRLGAKWDYKHPSDVMKEIASLTPIFAGVTYERLEGYKSLQWPVAEDGTDSPVLFMEKFHFPDGKAKFHPVEWVEPCEEVSPEFALHLNNGRLLEHFQQGAMTYRSEGVKRMTPTNFVEVSPELARERKIDSGVKVALRSPHGEVTVPVVVTDRVYGTQLYMPMNSAENPVNRLTSSNVDRAVHTPAYKEVSVSLTPVSDGAAPNPLPPENFRHGHRTSQEGVEVERKWSRPDYQLPGTHPADKLVQIETTHV